MTEAFGGLTIFNMKNAVLTLLFLGIALAFANPAIADGGQFEVKFETEHFEFYSHGRNIFVNRIFNEAEKIRSLYVSELGSDFEGKTKVYFANNKEEFDSLQPKPVSLSDYVVGIAWPDHNTIILKFYASAQTGLPDLYKTFKHELSHIVFGRVTNFNDMPKWFIEGIAMFQADEWSLDEYQRLMTAAVGGTLYSMSELEDYFPSGHSQTSLAYTQSRNFASWIYKRLGEDKFHEFIKSLGAGKPFYESLREASGTSVRELEKQWLETLRLKYSWIPFLSGGSLLWFLISALFVVGYARIISKKRKKMAQMAAEEAEIYGEELPETPPERTWAEKRKEKKERIGWRRRNREFHIYDDDLQYDIMPDSSWNPVPDQYDDNFYDDGGDENEGPKRPKRGITIH